jgi:hypothetical protein
LTRNTFTTILKKFILRRILLLGFCHEILDEGISQEAHGTAHHGY